MFIYCGDVVINTDKIAYVTPNGARKNEVYVTFESGQSVAVEGFTLKEFCKLIQPKRYGYVDEEGGVTEFDGGNQERLSILDRNIRSLNITNRARNTLERNNIRTIGAIIERHQQRDLRVLPEMGAVSFNKIKRGLEQVGLSLDMDISQWKADNEK